MKIRAGGFKGVLVVDTRLKEDRDCPDIVFRRSMQKFQSNHHQLEVIQVAKASPCYLNRQIILLLSALGLPTATLEILQEDYLENVTQQRQTNAASLLRRFGCNNLMINQLVTLLEEEASNKQNRLYYEPFIIGLLDALMKKVKVDVIKKGRIGLENGRSLMGVLDETGTLDYGEVFFQLRDSKSPPDGTLICVTKSPCLHPGDIRLLRLRYVVELTHLVDCICFPSKGSRPHPNECSGSDLDGDIYFVCWDDSIIEHISPVPPMSYTETEPKLFENVGINDVQSSFIDFIKSNRLGQIANAWVAWADKKGAGSEQCKQLAELHSRAVDSPKTGEVVTLPSKLIPIEYPNYMEKLFKGVYKSTSAVGVLYNNANNWKLPISHSNCVKESSFVASNYQIHLSSATETYKNYKSKISHLIETHLLKNEYELWTSPIPKVRDNVNQLMQEYRDWFEKEEPNSKEWSGKSYAWYIATSSNREDIIGCSFAWIVGDHLIKNSG